MTKRLIFLGVGLLAIASTCFADSVSLFSPFIGYRQFSDQRKTDSTIQLGVGIERYYSQKWGYEARLGYSPITIRGVDSSSNPTSRSQALIEYALGIVRKKESKKCVSKLFAGVRADSLGNGGVYAGFSLGLLRPSDKSVEFRTAFGDGVGLTLERKRVVANLQSFMPEDYPTQIATNTQKKPEEKIEKIAAVDIEEIAPITPDTLVVATPTKVEKAESSPSENVVAIQKIETSEYKDIESHWAKADIEKVAAAWLMRGQKPGYFEPEKGLTNEQVARVLTRLVVYLTENATPAPLQWNERAQKIAVNFLPEKKTRYNKAINSADFLEDLGKAIAIIRNLDTSFLGTHKSYLAVVENELHLEKELVKKLDTKKKMTRARAAKLLAISLDTLGKTKK